MYDVQQLANVHIRTTLKSILRFSKPSYGFSCFWKHNEIMFELLVYDTWTFTKNMLVYTIRISVQEATSFHTLAVACMIFRHTDLHCIRLHLAWSRSKEIRDSTVFIPLRKMLSARPTDELVARPDCGSIEYEVPDSYWDSHDTKHRTKIYVLKGIHSLINQYSMQKCLFRLD